MRVFTLSISTISHWHGVHTIFSAAYITEHGNAPSACTTNNNNPTTRMTKAFSLNMVIQLHKHIFASMS